MADDLVDLRPSAGGGGLDDSPAGGPDDAGFQGAEDALLTPQGPVESINDNDGALFPDGGEGDGEGSGEWFEAFPEEMHDSLSKFRSPEDMARSYLENERRMGEFRSEVGELRNEIAQLASQGDRSRGPDGEGYGSEPRNERVPTMQDVAGFAEEIAQAIDQGDIDVGAGIARLMAATAGVSAAREEDLMRRFEARIAERTAPLEESNFRTTVAREIQALKAHLGDEQYAALEPQAKALLKEWERQQPGFVSNARAVRAAFGEANLLSQAQQRREASARVLDSTAGGGRRRGPSPAQMIVDEMDALGIGGKRGGLL